MLPRNTHREKPGNLPPSERVWKELLRRGTDPLQTSLTGNNNIFIWWAFIVIHDFFR